MTTRSVSWLGDVVDRELLEWWSISIFKCRGTVR
jgi:hypothetical protein